MDQRSGRNPQNGRIVYTEHGGHTGVSDRGHSESGTRPSLTADHMASSYAMCLQDCPLARFPDATRLTMSITPYLLTEEPYYQPVDSEIAVYESVYRLRLPLMLKRPTGCGKSRFVEH